MKICFYNLTAGFKSGGLETYCWEVGRALARQGHEVHIFGGEGGVARNSDVKLIALPYTPRHRFPNLGTRFRKLAERLSFAKHAKAILAAGGYDAVVVNKPYDFPVLSWLKRKGYTGATAVRSGGTDFYLGDRLFANAVDLWLSSSAYNAAQVEARYGRPVTVIHNGVDPERFAPNAADASIRARFGIPPDAVTIVSAGRLVGWKGYHLIVEALRTLPAMHYLAIGGGEERQRLEILAKETGVADRIHFAGEVAHKDLPAYLCAGNVFVQPSIGEEAFGISVVEAMSCALPVLASNQGGLREIVQPGKTGQLLPVGDLPAWQTALAAMADVSARNALGAAGRERVLAKFTWEGNARHLLALLASHGEGT